MNETPRLCMVVPTHWSARMGGAQYQAKLLAEHLSERYRVDIVYLTTRVAADFRSDAYRVVRFSEPGGIRRFGFFLDARRLYRALSAFRPDLIYQQVGCGHTGISAGYARRHKCRMIWRLSSDRSVEERRIPFWQVHRRLERRFEEYGIRNADIVLAQTDYQKRLLVSRYRRNDAVVVRNFHPVPDEDCVKETSYKQIVWIANLKRLKNPEAFLRLCESLSAREDLRFVMIGQALTQDAWTSCVMEAIERTPRIRYTGGITQNEVNAILAKSHLLVNTSDYEGFSNTFIQAWMRSVPVVSLSVDPDGLLSAEGLGKVAGSEKNLRREVEELLSSPERLNALGHRCRQYALAHHTEANIDRIAEMMGLERRPE